MKKRVFTILVLLILSIVTACTSTEPISLSQEDQERAMSALELLSQDMLEQISLDITSSSLEDALASSYIIYKDYVPLYDSYKDRYLESVATIAESAIEELYPSIYSDMLELAKTPDRYIEEDTSFTKGLRSKSRTKLIESFATILSDKKEALDKAFEPSLKEFDSIRKAYLNLYSVDGGITLPEVSGVNLNVISYRVIDILFSTLSEKEKELKNRVIDRNSDSLYSVFWEDRAFSSHH